MGNGRFTDATSGIINNEQRTSDYMEGLFAVHHYFWYTFSLKMRPNRRIIENID